MKTRCNTPSSTNYKRYGARGIRVCAEWDTYEPFRDWAISAGYQPYLTIERIDVYGDYSPDNCKWITKQQQQYNKRTSRVMTAFGETKTFAEWVADPRCVVKRATLAHRIDQAGWPIEKALTSPLFVRRTSFQSN